MDKIVAGFQLQGFGILVTEQGVVYRLAWNSTTERMEIRLELQINVVGK